MAGDIECIANLAWDKSLVHGDIKGDKLALLQCIGTVVVQLMEVVRMLYINLI